MSTPSAPAWSKPYHGVQHLGCYGPRNHWCTVEDYGTFADLSCWFPGCGFYPKHSKHSTAAEARAAGERYLAEHQ